MGIFVILVAALVSADPVFINDAINGVAVYNGPTDPGFQFGNMGTVVAISN